MCPCCRLILQIRVYCQIVVSWCRMVWQVLIMYWILAFFRSIWERKKIHPKEKKLYTPKKLPKWEICWLGEKVFLVVFRFIHLEGHKKTTIWTNTTWSDNCWLWLRTVHLCYHIQACIMCRTHLWGETTWKDHPIFFICMYQLFEGKMWSKWKHWLHSQWHRTFSPLSFSLFQPYLLSKQNLMNATNKQHLSHYEHNLNYPIRPIS